MGRIFNDLVEGIQLIIDGINYALAFLSNIGDYIANTVKNIL